MKQEYDIIIIGGGALGTFHAYFAAKKGLNVLLLEKNPAPNNATVRNFGMVATGSIAEKGEWRKYAEFTNQLYRELNDEIDDDITLRKNGSYVIVENDLEDKVLKEVCDLGYAEYLNSSEIKERVPNAKESYIKSGAYFEKDMSVDPTQFIHKLHNYFQRISLFDIQMNTPVVRIENSGEGKVVFTQDGEKLFCGKVLICTGTDFQFLYQNEFMNSGMKICKLQMMRSVPAKPIPTNILSGLSLYRYPVFQEATSLNALKESFPQSEYTNLGIHLLFKQADDGSVIIGDSHQYFNLNQTINYEISSEVNNKMLKYAERMLDIEIDKISHYWNGFYMVNPGSEIYNNEVVENTHIITGIGGKGMSTGAGFSKFNIDKILE